MENTESLISVMTVLVMDRGLGINLSGRWHAELSRSSDNHGDATAARISSSASPKDRSPKYKHVSPLDV